jgi:methionyl-tRNA formyltransferase
MKIVFFGTPEFSATILEKLVKNNLKPVLVITAPDMPVGRRRELTPPAVKLLAEKYQIPVLQPQDFKDPVFKQALENVKPDLVVLAAFGPPFLPSWLLSFPKYGCVNLRPSLLPKYRGASPIAFAILNNEKETGVSIMRMSEKIDQGDILGNINKLSQALTFLLSKIAGFQTILVRKI